MIDWNGDDRAGSIGRHKKSKKTGINYGHFAMSQVTSDESDLQSISCLSQNQPDEVTDVQYCVTGLPKDMACNDKLACLSKLADTITNIESSDVFVISMWIGG